VKRAGTAAVLTFALGAVVFAATPDGDDQAAGIRRACDAYVSAWRANDRSAVMATLTEDAVLLPAHGRPAVSGRAAIERMWWPSDAPPSTVDAFRATIVEASAQGDLGFARGEFDLSFTYAGSKTEQHGTYLMILRRGPNGVWRISHRMWDDRIAR